MVCNIVIWGGLEPSSNRKDSTSTLQPPEPAVRYPWHSSGYSFVPCSTWVRLPSAPALTTKLPLPRRRRQITSGTRVQFGRMLIRILSVYSAPHCQQTSPLCFTDVEIASRFLGQLRQIFLVFFFLLLLLLVDNIPTDELFLKETGDMSFLQVALFFL